MKIMYNSEAFAVQKFGGITKYYFEIISHMEKSGFIKPEFPSSIFDNIYLRDVDKWFLKDNFLKSLVRFCKQKNIPRNEKFIKVYNRLSSIKEIKKGDFDLFHPTYYSPYFLSILKKPFVITVHDMIHERFRENFDTNNRISVFKKEVLNNAKRIIAISENTKKDIVEILKIDSEKIDVIRHGINLTDWTLLHNFDYPQLPEDFILFVGERKGYKNFSKFINVFSSIIRFFPKLKVICTGKPFTGDEMALFKDLKLASDNVLHFYAKENHLLAYLYSKAKVFIYPSLYEGFGMPILEAFACNCPVIASNTSCFFEVAEHASLYFDPYSDESMISCLMKVLGDKSISDELINKGKHRLELFTWDKAASETFKSYQRACN